MAWAWHFSGDLSALAEAVESGEAAALVLLTLVGLLFVAAPMHHQLVQIAVSPGTLLADT